MNKIHQTNLHPDALADKPICRLFDNQYSWRQIIAYNEFTGRLRDWITRLTTDFNLIQTAQRHGYEVKSEILQSIADHVRYHLNLITSEETLFWLESHELTVDDFNDFLLRRYWREYSPNPLDGIVLDLDMSVLNWSLWCELNFTNELKSMAIPYLQRVMIQHEYEVPTLITNEDKLSISEQFCCRESHANEKLVDILKRKLYLNYENFWDNVALEIGYRNFGNQYATNEQCAQFFNLNRINYLIVDYEMLHYSSLASAQEAYLCITEDGESLAEVALRTGAQYHHREQFGEDLKEPYRQRLLSASPNDYLPPVESSGGKSYWVGHVIEKNSSDVNDPLVREKIRDHLIAEFLAPTFEIKGHWLI